MKKVFYVTILLLTLLIGVGCNETSPIPDEISSKDSIQARKADALLSFFCTTKLDANGKITYTPNWGTVLYDSNPTVRYVAVDHLEDARRWFFYFVRAAEPDMQQDITEYTIEGHGSIRFTTATTSDRIATIHVDFVALPEVKEFVFIAKDRWPHNDISPFTYGAVYVEKKTGDRYICINESVYEEGRLITFDNKTGKRWKLLPDPGWRHVSYIEGLPGNYIILENLRSYMYRYDFESNSYIKDVEAEKTLKSILGPNPNVYKDRINFPITHPINDPAAHLIFYIKSNHAYVLSNGQVDGLQITYNLSNYVLSDIYTFESYTSDEEFERIQ